ncbi:unnamed protein product, partial [Leptidea sinapis]
MSQWELNASEIDCSSQYQEDAMYIGDKGDNTQTTMHDVHGETEVMFFAEMGRDAVTCWNTNLPFLPSNVEVLAHLHFYCKYKIFFK